MPCTTQAGMTLLRGFSDNLLKLFLDNDGDISPEQVMEAAVDDKKYESLHVVDRLTFITVILCFVSLVLLVL